MLKSVWDDLITWFTFTLKSLSYLRTFETNFANSFDISNRKKHCRSRLWGLLWAIFRDRIIRRNVGPPSSHLLQRRSHFLSSMLQFPQGMRNLQISSYNSAGLKCCTSENCSGTTNGSDDCLVYSTFKNQFIHFLLLNVLGILHNSVIIFFHLIIIWSHWT